MTRQGDDALLAHLTLDDRPGPATRISSARAHAMVESALDAVLADVAAAARASAPPEPVTPRASKKAAGWVLAQSPLVRALTLAAAALLVLAGGAAAARLVAWMHDEPPAPAPSTSPAKSAARLPRAAAQPQPVPSSLRVEPAATAEAATPAPRAPRAGAGRTKDAREGALEDLLQQANRARADGEFGEAAALYAQVYDGRPSSLSAYVALVAAASLELEHLDRPARARKLFEAALRARPSGALDLEARQGLALALRDLGARSDEIAALRKLIALHPGRPAAARARARLAELGE